MRPKISVYISLSIDGYIARADGNLDWLEMVADQKEDYGFKSFLTSVDAVILGRNTYEVAATAYGTPIWPYGGKKMIVLSKTLSTVIPEAQIYSGQITELIKQLQGCKHIWIDGGNTISQFLQLHLVDEMILSIVPILLGKGISLFDLTKEIPCRLISSQSYPSGLVQIHYGL